MAQFIVKVNNKDVQFVSNNIVTSGKSREPP